MPLPGGMIVSATEVSRFCSVEPNTDSRAGRLSALQASAHAGKAMSPADAAIRVRIDSLRFMMDGLVQTFPKITNHGKRLQHLWMSGGCRGPFLNSGKP